MHMNRNADITHDATRGYVHLGDIMATLVMPTQVAREIYITIYLFLRKREKSQLFIVI